MKPTQTSLFSLLGIVLLFFSFRSSHAQCRHDFKATSDGQKINITWSSVVGKINLSVFTIQAKVEKVSELSVEGAKNSYTLTSLAPGTYVVKVEWENGCSTNVGGLEGLIIKAAKNE